MTRKTNDSGGAPTRPTKGIAPLNNVYQSGTVQARLEGDAYAADSAVARLERLQEIVFADEPTFPAALPGFFNTPTNEYALEGHESSGEWMVADLDSIALTEEWR